MGKVKENIFTTEISASQKKVWEIMTDHQRYSKWSPAKKVILEKEGSPEKNGKGAIRVFKSGIKVREEVVGWDKPNSMTYRLLASWPVRNYEAKMSLETTSSETGDEITKLTWHSKWENRLPGFLGALPAKVLRKSLIKFAKGIKADAQEN